MKRRQHRRCATCGAYVVPHEARIRTDQDWAAGERNCPQHPTAPTVEWDRRGADGSLALAYEYIRAAYRSGGAEAADALAAGEFDAAHYPGATPGTLALARSYHRKWRLYEAPLPAVTGGLYS